MTLRRFAPTLALARVLLAAALAAGTFAVPASAQIITSDSPPKPRVKKPKTPKTAKPPKTEKPKPAKPAKGSKPAPIAVPADTLATPPAQSVEAPREVAATPAPVMTTGPLPRTLSELKLQKSDRVIARDLAAIDGWQAKIATLPGAEADVWRAAAAKAWLEAARVEYTDNDRQGFPQGAFERAVALVSEIEAGRAPVDSSNAPAAVIPRGSVKVADSLYTRLVALKENPGFRCAREPIAQMEVELAWAGNEQIDQGDCRTSPHLARAAELARTAQELCERCLPPPVAKLEEPPVPVPVDTMRVVHVETPTREEMRIPRNIHYALNEFVVSPTSRHVIAGIAALLQKYPTVTARLVGHTDSRGSQAYNLELSRRRVNAARAVFIELGIDSTRLSTDYRGKSDIYAIEDSKKAYALNRRVEMVFVDAEGHDIAGERQESDLQLEGERSSKPKFSVTPKPAAPKRAVAPGRAPIRRKPAATTAKPGPGGTTPAPATPATPKPATGR